MPAGQGFLVKMAHSTRYWLVWEQHLGGIGVVLYGKTLREVATSEALAARC